MSGFRQILNVGDHFDQPYIKQKLEFFINYWEFVCEGKDSFLTIDSPIRISHRVILEKCLKELKDQNQKKALSKCRYYFELGGLFSQDNLVLRCPEFSDIKKLSKKVYKSINHNIRINMGKNYQNMRKNYSVP